MAEYPLTYGQPRPSLDGIGIIYETKGLRAEHPDDSAAMRWAREVVPYERGLTLAASKYTAAPIELWRGREIVWRHAPGRS